MYFKVHITVCLIKLCLGGYGYELIACNWINLDICDQKKIMVSTTLVIMNLISFTKINYFQMFATMKISFDVQYWLLTP
jgi:hypothetical protein